MPADLLPCPFCGSQPVTRVDAERQIYSVECPKCVTVGFYNHFRFGCMADCKWNERANTMVEKIPSHNSDYDAPQETAEEIDTDTQPRQPKMPPFKDVVQEFFNNPNCESDPRDSRVLSRFYDCICRNIGQ